MEVKRIFQESCQDFAIPETKERLEAATSASARLFRGEMRMRPGVREAKQGVATSRLRFASPPTLLAASIAMPLALPVTTLSTFAPPAAAFVPLPSAALARAVTVALGFRADAVGAAS